MVPVFNSKGDFYLKIDSYNVGMDSARTYSSSSTRKLALYQSGQVYQGSFTNLAYNLGNSQYRLKDSDDSKESESSESGAATSPQDFLDRMNNRFNSRVNKVSESSDDKKIENVRNRYIQYLWQIFFGPKKAHEMSERMGWPYESADDGGGSSTAQSSEGASFSTITITGVEEVSFEEHESLSFRSAGDVTTADGRHISFNFEVEMSRSFSAYYRQEGIPVTSMCDPLVLNFDGQMAGLSDQKFFFDLDGDGSEEEISTLDQGNGFLALDKNGDGTINDGSELFGTKSGDGFSDLAKYDSDHNGWIDENDDIYNMLKIWVKDSSGEDKLYSLKEKNVGAIYLGNNNTSYSLRSDMSGSLNGAIRKTGVFLYEDGSGVGAINHLDIAN